LAYRIHRNDEYFENPILDGVSTPRFPFHYLTNFFWVGLWSYYKNWFWIGKIMRKHVLVCFLVSRCVIEQSTCFILNRLHIVDDNNIRLGGPISFFLLVECMEIKSFKSKNQFEWLANSIITAAKWIYFGEREKMWTSHLKNCKFNTFLALIWVIIEYLECANCSVERLYFETLRNTFFLTAMELMVLIFDVQSNIYKNEEREPYWYF
jgi:hypothetical protein